MLVAVAAIAFQTVRPQQLLLAIGSSPEIAHAFQTVAALTEKKDFAGAKVALHLLPSEDIRVKWDDSALSPKSRFDVQRQRDRAFQEWSNACPIHFTVVKDSPDIAFVLQSGPGSNVVWSDKTSDARLTQRIGFNGAALNLFAIHNDVSFALGLYAGINKLPIEGLLMAGSDDSISHDLSIIPLESNIANGNLNACRRLRDAIDKSQVVSSGLPTLTGDFKPIDMGKVLQGTKIPLDFSITNSGAGMLSFKIIPDCSCFATTAIQFVDPGKSKPAKAQMDTLSFAGPVHHRLFVVSNDAVQPIREIPVTVYVTPRYRMLPEHQVIIADEKGEAVHEAFLYFPSDHPITITSAVSQGLPGDVTFEPWQGDMADPVLKEGALPRKGYKVSLKLKDIPDGAQLGTNIVLGTDDSNFPSISYTVGVQKGIVALPPSVYMGEMGAAPRTVPFVLTRPGLPFNITDIQSDSAHIKASYKQSVPGEYRVTIVYDGKAAVGDYHATISIKTDDPKQKLIEVAVQGTVR